MTKKEQAEKRILSYVNGLLYFYGIMDYTSLYKAVLDNLPFTPEMDTFMFILEREIFNDQSPYDLDSDDDFCFHVDVEDVDWVWEEQEARGNIPYRPVTEEEAWRIANKDYLSLWAPPVVKLYTHLQEVLGWPKEEALQTILHSQKLLRHGVEPTEVLKEFMGKIEFRGLEDVQPFMNMVTEMANHTPLWILKGWTPCEVLEQEKGGAAERFATVSSGAAEATSARTEPSLEEWRSLYEAAAAFKRAACWEWMYDDDLFGVMDPETGEIAYCCIMGNLGEHYALGAYLGAEGLGSILDILSGEADDEEEYSPDDFFNQKCLMASFRDRDELVKEDREIIKKLGLKFRGSNNWPLFRSHEPGFFPWFLNAWECRFLTAVLQQSLEVALRCRSNKAILEHEKPFTFLVRVPEKEEGGRIVWADRYLQATPPVKKYPSFAFSDELYLKKLVKSLQRGRGAWEAEAFWLPYPVRESKNKRPYYPLVILIVDRASGLVLGHEMLKNLPEDGYRCIDALLRLLEKGGPAPSRIVVEDDKTYYLLEKACSQLNISLEKVNRLEVIPAVREEIYHFEGFGLFSRQPF